MGEAAFGAIEFCVNECDGSGTFEVHEAARTELSNMRKLLEQTEAAVTEINYCYRQMKRQRGQILERIEEAVESCRPPRTSPEEKHGS